MILIIHFSVPTIDSPHVVPPIKIRLNGSESIRARVRDEIPPIADRGCTHRIGPAHLTTLSKRAIHAHPTTVSSELLLLWEDGDPLANMA